MTNKPSVLTCIVFNTKLESSRSILTDPTSQCSWWVVQSLPPPRQSLLLTILLPNTFLTAPQQSHRTQSDQVSIYRYKSAPFNLTCGQEYRARAVDASAPQHTITHETTTPLKGKEGRAQKSIMAELLSPTVLQITCSSTSEKEITRLSLPTRPQLHSDTMTGTRDWTALGRRQNGTIKYEVRCWKLKSRTRGKVTKMMPERSATIVLLVWLLLANLNISNTNLLRLFWIVK